MEGKRQLDILHGTIWNKISQFALPVAATAFLEQLFNASDVAVVGNFTGGSYNDVTPFCWTTSYGYLKGLFPVL